MTHVWKLKGLYATEKFVLLALADNANNDGACWPSIPDIAERCELQTRQTINIIGNLVKKGIIRREMRSGKSSVYYFNTPALECTPTPASHCTPANIAPLQNLTHTPALECTPTPAFHCTPPTPPYIEEPSFEPSIEEPSNIYPDSAELQRIKKMKKNFHAEFPQFWEAYPLKTGKLDAEKAYVKARNAGTAHEAIMAGITSYRRKLEAEATEEKYIKHPSTWLNKGCWSDDYTIHPRKINGENYGKRNGYPERKTTNEVLAEQIAIARAKREQGSADPFG